MSPGLRNRNVIKKKKDVLVLRAKILDLIRLFFKEREFIEVETPFILPYIIPEAYIDPIKTEVGYLHTSPELCMKMLLGLGCNNIFQICKCFRKGERSKIHLPEFTMLEWYHVGIDYNKLMEECELLIRNICYKLFNKEKINYQGNEVDLATPWNRISLTNAFEKYANISLYEAVDKGIFEEILVYKVEPKLGFKQPVFVKDYPASMAALAKLQDHNPNIAERFELYICGLEIANGYTELTDMAEMKKRWETENQKRTQMGKCVYPFPNGYKINIPDCSGVALGIDRLIMLFSDKDRIDSVVSMLSEDI